MKKKIILLSIAVQLAMQLGVKAQTTITIPVADTDEVGVFYEDNTVPTTSTSTVTTNTQDNQPPSVVDKQWKELDLYYKKIISEQRLATIASFDDVKFIYHILGCRSEVWLCFLEDGNFFLSNTMPNEAMTPTTFAEIGCGLDPINGSIMQTNNLHRVIKRYEKQNQTINKKSNTLWKN